MEDAGRRRALTLIAGAALSLCPARATAVAGVPRIAGLGWRKDWGTAVFFFERLAEVGYVEPRSLEVGYIYPRVRLRDAVEADWMEAARRAVEWRPDLIAVIGPGHIRRIRSVAAAVPIVFGGIDDPVGEGVVSSLRHPGHNVTGVAVSSDGIAAKVLELTREVLPRAQQAALLFDSGIIRAAEGLTSLRAAASRLGFTLIEADASQPGGGIDAALHRIETSRARVVLVLGALSTTHEVKRVGEFQRSRRIPVVAAWGSGAGAAGFLLSLGENQREHVRRMADVAAQVLQHRVPAGEIPVDVAARVELTLHRGTARELGIELPKSMLARADHVLD